MTPAEFALLKRADPDCIFLAHRHNATRASGLNVAFYDVITKARVETVAASMSPGEKARFRIAWAPAITAVEEWLDRFGVAP